MTIGETLYECRVRAAMCALSARTLSEFAHALFNFRSALRAACKAGLNPEMDPSVQTTRQALLSCFDLIKKGDKN